MEIITREKVQKSTYDVYVAADGLEFTTLEECKKYEESAEGVIMAKVKPMVIKEFTEEDMFGFGSCESTIWVIKPTTQKDMDTIMKAVLVINPHFAKDDFSHHLERARKLIQRALDENDVIFVGRGYEMDSFWLIGTRNSMKETLDGFTKTDEQA